MERIEKFLFIYPLPDLVIPLIIPLVPSITEEITVCTNEVAKGGNKAPRNPPSCFFIPSFTVSVTSSINTPKSSIDFIIFIISFISSFEINKVNPFAGVKALFPAVFVS